MRFGEVIEILLPLVVLGVVLGDYIGFVLDEQARDIGVVIVV